jgi:hypothetical protein
MNRMQNKSTEKVVNISVETVTKFKYLENKETNETYRHE